MVCGLAKVGYWIFDARWLPEMGKYGIITFQAPTFEVINMFPGKPPGKKRANLLAPDHNPAIWSRAADWRKR
jgi:hypothetical protein